MPIQSQMGLPWARRHLRAASWGFDALLRQPPDNISAMLFHFVGILASLRAVQHSLNNHDRKLSPRHDEIVSQWWKEHREIAKFPELHFIIELRNRLLKGGAFAADAMLTEQDDDTVGLAMAYYDGDKRHDLEFGFRSAIQWCDRELTRLEAQLDDARS